MVSILSNSRQSLLGAFSVIVNSSGTFGPDNLRLTTMTAASCVQGWQYGDAVHFTSTVFMNLGYGWRTPLTAGGKWLTLVIILLQIPFYTHCLATLAARING